MARQLTQTEIRGMSFEEHQAHGRLIAPLCSLLVVVYVRLANKYGKSRELARRAARAEKACGKLRCHLDNLACAVGARNNRADDLAAVNCYYGASHRGLSDAYGGMALRVMGAPPLSIDEHRFLAKALAPVIWGRTPNAGIRAFELRQRANSALLALFTELDRQFHRDHPAVATAENTYWRTRDGLPRDKYHL